MSKLHQIQHCTVLGPQQYIRKVGRLDERLLIYAEDKHTYVQTYVLTEISYFIVGLQKP